MSSSITLGRSDAGRTLKFERLEGRQMLAVTPQLIDIDPTPTGGNPGGFIQFGDSIYFTSADYDTGRELYRMAAPLGTPELVADLSIGVASSNINIAGVVNDRLMFSTYRVGGEGYRLWSVTDGGTPVQFGQFSTSLRFGDSSAVFGGELYFVADTGISGLELWKSDGTPGSVTQVVELFPGADHGYPNYLTIFNGELVFAGRSPAGSSQLWKISSPGASPVSFANITPGGYGSDIIILGELNGELYFSAESAGKGRELWKTDGTPDSAVLVKDIRGGSSGSSPGLITVMNGIGYFTAQASTAQGYELWRTDGTEGGTYLVVDLTDRLNTGTFPGHMTVWNDRLYFSGSTNYTGEYLYSTDGTAAGTAPVKYLGSSQTLFGPRNIASMQVFDDKLVFVVDDETSELWTSDGTEEGTQRISQYVHGDHFGVGQVTAIGDLLYMNAGGNVTGTGGELWTSDGTAEGTGLYYEINQGTFDGKVTQVVHAGGMIYLLANDKLYRMSDQTRVPQYVGKYDTPRNLTVVGDRVYFTAINSIGRPELNFVDFAGYRDSVTVLVGSFWRSFDARSLLAVGNELYFTGRMAGASGYELWKTDGTSAGTVKVKTLYTGSNDYIPYLQTVIDGVVYLTANDGVHGNEWWKSDGTEAGTQMIADINPGAGSGAGNEIMKVGNTIYITAQNGTQGYEPWTYNPETGIPSLLKDIYAGSGHSSPGWFTPLGDKLIFTARELTSGPEVYSTDGTAAGTVKLTNVPGGGTSIGPVTLTQSNGVVYFGVDASGAGSQLWKTDGTLAGTGLLKQIGTNVANGMVSAFDHKGVLYFSSQTESHRNELWRSDGTVDGTYEVADIAPGPASSSPKNFVSVAGALYFYAENYQFGRELYVIPSASDSGDFNHDDATDGTDLELWQTYFGTSDGPGLAADADRNGRVDGRDFLAWQRNFAAKPAAVAAVAEDPVALLVHAKNESATLGFWILEQEKDEEPALLLESPQVEVPIANGFAASEFDLPARAWANEDGSSGIRDDLNDSDNGWLSEELLERVFG